jgi:predicted aspartyl protease
VVDGVRVVAGGAWRNPEFDGRRHRLVVGDQAVSVVSASGGAAPSMVIQEDSRGHFNVSGAVNWR